MHANYLETMPSDLSTVNDPGLVEALHDLAVALAEWQEQTAAEDVDVHDMADAGALVLERLKTAANTAITVAAMESASR
jgi:hypothetical protein